MNIQLQELIDRHSTSAMQINKIKPNISNNKFRKLIIQEIENYLKISKEPGFIVKSEEEMINNALIMLKRKVPNKKDYELFTYSLFTYIKDYLLNFCVFILDFGSLQGDSTKVQAGNFCSKLSVKRKSLHLKLFKNAILTEEDINDESLSMTLLLIIFQIT